MEPLITFKAGQCDFDTSSSPPRVTPKLASGYIYLYEEDELIHFCWRTRDASVSAPELDLMMVPQDGQFVPHKQSGTSPTNGRIFQLKFSSSSQRYFFWLQSQSQHPQGDKDWFSPRDLKIGEVVNKLLQGDEVDARQEVRDAGNQQGDDGHDDTMEDPPPASHGDIQGNIGSGDPSMGNVEDEGEESREGGADGGRAAAIAVQNFLRSMQGNQTLGTQQAQPQGQIFTTLNDLLPPATTMPWVDSLDSTSADNLLTQLPPVLLLLSQEAEDLSSADPNSETAKVAMEALSLDQKKEILRKVLRSPQFSQSCASLTGALRDGGLPSVSEALRIPVKDGGFIRRGGVPLGGGDAVEAFLNGVKEGEKDKGKEDKMETD
ncbi:26S proteasome regulatory subunit N13, partial [Lecanoromycetidae sp. Uapishka_2]